MAEPRPLASLTSGLLARKGQAQPAMRRPMPGTGRSPAAPLMQDDLGWDDMGFDVEPPSVEGVQVPVSIGLTPLPAVEEIAPPPVVTERKALAERIAAAPIQSALTKAKTRAASGRKAAFTLRLDADRHLKLRLAGAVTGRSAQQIVTQALDEFLHALPEVDALARQVPHRGDK